MTIKAKTGTHSRILSVGSYRPKHLVMNSEIVDRIESSDEWIQQRTGIVSRRFADESESVVDMAATAISARLGNPTAAAFDIGAACAGFSYAVSMAHDFVFAGTSKKVLVIGVEKISDFTDPDDRATAFIFADGAGAVVIGASDTPGIGPVVWGSDADNRDAITMDPPWTAMRSATQKSVGDIDWPNISQEGQKVFRWAVYAISKAALAAIEQAGLTVDDIDVFIPHQANLRIIETMAKEMKLPATTVIADDIRVNGNTSAASIPLAMDILLNQRPDLHGKTALIIGYGAGLVYAGQVVELPPKP